ncbi:MAG: hypothetical protein P9L98_04395 [Candidatus Kaelpia imicola]|nr:hypothetical protein [Candidatus Kaelpia imicola]
MNNVFKRRTTFLYPLTLFLLLSLGQVFADNADDIFMRAKKSAKRGQLDFAFSDLHFLVALYPESEHYEDSLFALGEYYYGIGAYHSALKNFNEILKINPESKARIFIKVYLMEIAKKRGDSDRVNKFKKEIVVSEQLSLLFRDFKEYNYTSALTREYRAVYFIDKIKFFVDEKLFSEIYY